MVASYCSGWFMGDFSRPKRPMARHKRWISRCEVRNWMGQGDNMRLMCVYIYICINIYIYMTSTSTSISTSISFYIYIYLLLYLYLYLYLFLSIHIYIYYIDYAVDRCGSLEYSYVCLYLSWNWIPSPNGSFLRRFPTYIMKISTPEGTSWKIYH